MAESSYPFDAGAGSILTEAQWSTLAAPWQDNGVVANGPLTTVLKVTTLAELNTVYLEPGHAIIQGFHYENSAQLPLTFPTNSGGTSRSDIVLLRLDRGTNTITAVYKTGGGALVKSGLIYEIALADITVSAGGSSLTTGQIVDNRSFVGRRIQVSPFDVRIFPTGSVSYKPATGRLYLNSEDNERAIITDDVADATTTLLSSNNQITNRATSTSRSTVATTNDTALGNIALKAGKLHEIYMRIIWACTVATAGVTTFRLAPLPAGSTHFFTAFTMGTSGAMNGFVISDLTVGLNTTAETINSNEVLIIQGTVLAGADGTLIPQWGPNAASVTTSVQAGSYTRMTRAA